MEDLLAVVLFVHRRSIYVLHAHCYLQKLERYKYLVNLIAFNVTIKCKRLVAKRTSQKIQTISFMWIFILECDTFGVSLDFQVMKKVFRNLKIILIRDWATNITLLCE